jgi:hypothetical protein
MEVVTTDWMVMGMIHAYKIIQKASQAFDEEESLNDVDFPYLVELQRRDIENPSSLSAEFPYVFKEKNTSAHDNMHLGMMNVFNLLGEQKEKGGDMDGIDVPFLIESLSGELENADLLESYDDFFVDIERREGLEELR